MPKFPFLAPLLLLGNTWEDLSFQVLEDLSVSGTTAAAGKLFIGVHRHDP
jgi:hypothetical protein